MILRRTSLFILLLVLVVLPFLLPKITWLAGSQTVYGSMRFAGKNYSGQIIHSYSVISFKAGEDTIWFNSGDNIIFKEGEIVPVRYEIDNPSEARVNTFVGIWGDTIVYSAGPIFIVLVIFFHPKGVRRDLKLQVNSKRPFIQSL